MSDTNTHHLSGRVRNIHPNGKAPTWEVYFDADDYGDDFPAEHATWITIEWPSGSFRSMVGIKPLNPIYLRSKAAGVDGQKDSRVSDLCVAHGFDRAGKITLEVIEPRSIYRVVAP